MVLLFSADFALVTLIFHLSLTRNNATVQFINFAPRLTEPAAVKSIYRGSDIGSGVIDTTSSFFKRHARVRFEF